MYSGSIGNYNEWTVHINEWRHGLFYSSLFNIGIMIAKKTDVFIFLS